MEEVRDMAGKITYRCASCGKEFDLAEEDQALRCPECRGRTLIVVKGNPRKKKGKCAPAG
ncbi:MAG: DNA-directed RNA polymerase subunit P [Synergistetes bacterium ADurb.Bin155]|nr:MAG: DNA-directed RNA polymerase subunit P [Synergistetes bacterium ADurb.Bin155]